MRKRWGRFALVAGWPTLKDHEIRLEERLQVLRPAFSADPGLLEPAERDGEVRTHVVVTNRPGAELPGNLAGPG